MADLGSPITSWRNTAHYVHCLSNCSRIRQLTVPPLNLPLLLAVADDVSDMTLTASGLYPYGVLLLPVVDDVVGKCGSDPPNLSNAVTGVVVDVRGRFDLLPLSFRDTKARTFLTRPPPPPPSILSLSPVLTTLFFRKLNLDLGVEGGPRLFALSVVSPVLAVDLMSLVFVKNLVSLDDVELLELAVPLPFLLLALPLRLLPPLLSFRLILEMLISNWGPLSGGFLVFFDDAATSYFLLLINMDGDDGLLMLLSTIELLVIVLW